MERETLNDFFRDLKKLCLTGQIYINESKKCVTYVFRDYKRIVKCCDEDVFDWKIGVALTIERGRKFQKKYSVMRKIFTNKKGNLDYKKYAEWVLQDAFGYNFNEEKFLNNEYPLWKVKIITKENN